MTSEYIEYYYDYPELREVFISEASFTTWISFRKHLSEKVLKADKKVIQDIIKERKEYLERGENLNAQNKYRNLHGGKKPETKV